METIVTHWKKSFVEYTCTRDDLTQEKHNKLINSVYCTEPDPLYIWRIFVGSLEIFHGWEGNIGVKQIPQLTSPDVINLFAL